MVAIKAIMAMGEELTMAMDMDTDMGMVEITFRSPREKRNHFESGNDMLDSL